MTADTLLSVPGAYPPAIFVSDRIGRFHLERFVGLRRRTIRYRSFVYRSSEFGDEAKLQAFIRRDLVRLLVDNLEWFQSFDHVKIYYDRGQRAVSEALKSAFEYAPAKQAAVRRQSDYHDFRLSQVADYLCAIELTAEKCNRHAATETDEKFFGGAQSFKKNWLRQARRKRLN